MQVQPFPATVVVVKRGLLLAIVVGCAKPPPAAAPPHPSFACDVRGTVTMWSGVQLLVGGVPRLRFRGSAVAIEARVTAAEVTSVTVRSGNFRFAGTVLARELPLRSSRVIPIVKDHVWIEAGVPVDVSRGITSSYSQGLAGVSADVSCDALSLSRETRSFKVNGTPYHLAHDSFALFDAPHGHELTALTPKSKDLFTVYVERIERDYAHMVQRDWISVDGWVRVTDLIPGYGGDCDDCRGEGVMDAEDRCPDDGGTEDADGCPDVAKEIRVAQPTPILDDAGGVIGAVEKPAEVIVVSRKNGRAVVVPRAAEVLPVGTAWWVAESALGP
jgi:hypothetical protein